MIGCTLFPGRIREATTHHQLLRCSESQDRLSLRPACPARPPGGASTPPLAASTAKSLIQIMCTESMLIHTSSVSVRMLARWLCMTKTFTYESSSHFGYLWDHQCVVIIVKNFLTCVMLTSQSIRLLYILNGLHLQYRYRTHFGNIWWNSAAQVVPSFRSKWKSDRCPVQLLS